MDTWISGSSNSMKIMRWKGRKDQVFVLYCFCCVWCFVELFSRFCPLLFLAYFAPVFARFCAPSHGFLLITINSTAMNVFSLHLTRKCFSVKGSTFHSLPFSSPNHLNSTHLFFTKTGLLSGVFFSFSFVVNH